MLIKRKDQLVILSCRMYVCTTITQCYFTHISLSTVLNIHLCQKHTIMDDLSLQSEQWDFTAIIYQKKVLLKNKAADHHIVSNRIKLIQSAITQATTNLGVI